jgi:hypothetical protein
MQFVRLLSLSALIATTAFASFGPPWISIETPANPYDAASRGAFLLVHAFHHGTPMSFPVSGRAEGIANGERKTISLTLKPTSRPGVYALHKQWTDDGVWTLVLSVTQGEGEGNTVSAVVELGTNGQVASVDVPTVMRNNYRVPAPVSMASVEAGLRARAGRVATR